MSKVQRFKCIIHGMYAEDVVRASECDALDADRKACWDEFKVMNKALSEAKRERDALAEQVAHLESRTVFLPTSKIIDLLRDCRESLAEGLEDQGFFESDASKHDRTLVARIDQILKGV